jgi:hypothetical protein
MAYHDGPRTDGDEAERAADRRAYLLHGYDPHRQFVGRLHDCDDCPRRFNRYPNCEGCAGPGKVGER